MDGSRQDQELRETEAHSRLGLAEHPTLADDIIGLKARVERLEHRVSDLGAFVQAAVKEMRVSKRGCDEEVSLLGTLCLKCGDPVVYDFYCELHLPSTVRKVWKEIKARAVGHAATMPGRETHACLTCGTATSAPEKHSGHRLVAR